MFRRLLSLPNPPILWMSTLLHYGWGMMLVLVPEQVRLTTGLAPFQNYPEMYGLLFLVTPTAGTREAWVSRDRVTLPKA